MLALLLRSLVALAVTVPPQPTDPQSRAYTGAEAREDDLRSDDDAGEEAIVPPSPDEAPGPPTTAPTTAPTTSPTAAPATAPIPVATPTPEGPSEDEDTLDELPYDPLVDSPEAIRARHWVRSGAVFLALGAVFTIGAIAMSQAKVNVPETGQMDCNSRGDPAGNGCTKGGRARSTVALAVPGALLLGGGGAMLSVGKLQQRRLAASVQADRRSFALGLSWRF